MVALSMGISNPGFGQESAQSSTTEAIKLPKQQENPVFVFDMAGGFRRVPKTTPDLQIFADGRVIATKDKEEFKFKLTEQQLQEWLKFVVEETQIYQINSEQLVEAMKQAGQLPSRIIADAPTSEFKLDLPRGKHDVSVYALSLAVKNHPQLDALKNLMQLQHRCFNLTAVHRLGDRLKPILDAVNAEIKKQELPLEPVVEAEVFSFSEKDTGRMQVSFVRPQPNPENDRQPSINLVYFRKDAQSEPTLRVYGLQRE